MNLDRNARPILAGVIVIMVVLAVLSYVLPGTLSAYLFPGISNVGAAQAGD